MPHQHDATAIVPCQAPAAFARAIERAHPSVGRAWLDELGDVQRRLAADWELVSLDWLPARGSCVLRARTASGEDVVVKIPVVAADTESEGRALAYWYGDGGPRLLATDAASGALLIAWVEGRPFADEPDTADTLRAAGRFLRELHRPREAPPPSLPTLEEKLAPWRRSREERERSEAPGLGAAALRAEAPALDAAALRTEVAVREWLAETADGTTVIHGDLHPRNLLVRPEGGHCAIDPYGVVGDPARDAASLALFFREDGRAPERLDLVAGAAEVEHARVVAHAYALAVGAYRFRVAYGIPAGRAFLERVAGDLRRRLPPGVA